MSGDKKERILDAVCDLVETGVEPHELTVAQIAKKASVGKGTVYEYFGSKEDILEASLSYGAARIVLGVRSEIMSVQGFRERMEIIMNAVDCNAPHRSLVSEVLGGSGLLPWEVMCIKGEEHSLISGVADILDLVYAAAKKEDPDIPELEMSAARLAVASGIITYFWSKRLPCFFTRLDSEKVHQFIVEKTRCTLKTAAMLGVSPTKN